MIRSGRLAAILAALGSIVGAASPALAQSGDGVTIRVTYTNVIDRVRPDPRSGIAVTHRLTATLSGAKTVSEAWNSRSGPLAQQNSAVRVLGGSDSETGGRWQVVGPNELTRIIDYPQNQTIVRVKVTGRTCQATVSYVLKPGFKEFTFHRLQQRDIAYYSRARMTSSTCEIQ